MGIFFSFNYISILPCKALDKVTSSAYSKSAPTGIPYANLVTLHKNQFYIRRGVACGITPNIFMKFFVKKACFFGEKALK